MEINFPEPHGTGHNPYKVDTMNINQPLTLEPLRFSILILKKAKEKEQKMLKRWKAKK